MDVSRAQLSNVGDEVVLEDPAFPWRVTARVKAGTDQPFLDRLIVEAREDATITSTALAQIPVRQIAAVALSATRGDAETQFRMLAKPRPPGMRAWPAEHYQNVKRVADWARSVGWEGGGAAAVAAFWRVHLRTARRWLAHRQVSGPPSSRTP
jgi:hypothetical protein